MLVEFHDDDKRSVTFNSRDIKMLTVQTREWDDWDAKEEKPIPKVRHAVHATLDGSSDGGVYLTYNSRANAEVAYSQIKKLMEMEECMCSGS